MASAPLTQDLSAKTLEAWVQLGHLEQRAGGVIGVETLDGKVFDTIVFGEKQPKRWIVGSNNFARTQAIEKVADESEAMNRPVYESRLVRTWLPTMPSVVLRLQEGGRAIDVGCGTGIVPIALARGFPQARVEGLDMDARSIAIARAHARDAGLAGRIHFIQGAVSTLNAAEPYDFITTFDVIHDLPDPAGALAAIRAALAEGGTYLMVEPRVDDRLENNLGNPFGRMLHAISCLHCVPQSLAQGGPGLGACWGPAKARALALAAGFSHFVELPIRSPAMAFYEIRRA